MKITMYELLGMIKNDKAPKKIAIQNEVLIYNEGEILNLQDCYYMADDEDATWKIWAYELNEEVEILEEEKKIPEKLKDINSDFYVKDCYYEKLSKEEIALDLVSLKNLINSIIDYLKSKGDE